MSAGLSIGWMAANWSASILSAVALHRSQFFVRRYFSNSERLLSRGTCTAGAGSSAASNSSAETSNAAASFATVSSVGLLVLRMIFDKPLREIPAASAVRFMLQPCRRANFRIRLTRLS